MKKEELKIIIESLYDYSYKLSDNKEDTQKVILLIKKIEKRYYKKRIKRMV